jgi:hypothetical protein
MASFPQVSSPIPCLRLSVNVRERSIVTRTSPVPHVGLIELEGLRKTSSAKEISTISRREIL